MDQPTFTDRVNALAFLGLRPRETAFVATVALHGGYCLTRQYANYLGKGPNAYLTFFFQRLVDRKVARRIKYQSSRGWVYHISARRIYEAIGQSVTRHCVGHDTPGRVARRIMLLDFVLAHQQMSWYVSEADKIRLFKDRFGVSEADLPHHRAYAGGPRICPDGPRYAAYHFHEKWPVYVNEEDQPTRVHFVVLIGTDGRSFRAFLTQHTRLLAQLPAWTIMAVTPQSQAGLPACRAVFHRVFRANGTSAAPEPDGPPVNGLSDPEVSDYFRTRQALESGDVASVSAAAFDRYRDARLRYLGPDMEQAYAHWCVHQPADSRPRGSSTEADGLNGSQPCAGTLDSYRLPFSYALFGDFADEG